MNNLDEIIKHLQEMRSSIDEMKQDQIKIDSRIDELNALNEESHKVEADEIELVRDRWAKSRSEYTAEIQLLSKQKASLDKTVSAQEASIAVSESLLEMLTRSVQKEDVANVLEDLETSNTPDFKSAREKLGLDEAEEEGQEIPTLDQTE